MLIRQYILAIAMVVLTGCDPNASPTYGKTGLPKNCRAIIQANVEGWRTGKHSSDDAMASIERNCGENGHSWGR